MYLRFRHPTKKIFFVCAMNVLSSSLTMACMECGPITSIKQQRHIPKTNSVIRDEYLSRLKCENMAKGEQLRIGVD
ncbi:hypothetical protein DL96DRAFT_1640049 [Flagelloscypha sp. PMI_526]|nr:hypothetical protein DL96DRAFT_1640049 [Flagelloscypha sp. PMI_526]